MKIESLLDQYHIPYLHSGHHHCRPGWLQMDCPLCGKGSQKWHLGWRLSGRYFNCWKCGRFSPMYMIPLLTGLPEQTCRSLLRDLEVDYARLPSVKPTGTLKLPRCIAPLAACHRRYLRSRGFDPAEVVRLWDVAGIGLAAKLGWRLFIPIYFRGQVVSWTTRSISSTATKRYLSAPASDESISHKKILYGESYCVHSCVVVEGPLDVWKIGPGAVGTCGIGFSRAQVLRLSRYSRRVVCFDAEPDAQRRARDLCNQLDVFPGETINVILDSNDPGSATDKELRRLRKFLE